MDDLQPSDGRIDRRTALRRGLVAGGVALTVPVVTTFNMPAGAAASDAAPKISTATCNSIGGGTKQLTVTGTGIAGATVVLYRGIACDTALGSPNSATVGQTGSWSITVTSPGKGVSLTANQTTDGGTPGECSGPVTTPQSC